MMIRRAIFVGLHNKPGMKPLDSLTKTGRIIDAIAEGLGERWTIERSNLHDCDFLPTDDKYIINWLDVFIDWRIRVNFHMRTMKGAVVVSLGDYVDRQFTRKNIPHLARPHPAAPMSARELDAYIAMTIRLIKEFRYEKNNDNHKAGGTI